MEAPANGTYNTRARQPYARTMCRGARRSGQRWRLVHRFPPALRSPGRHSRLQRHRRPGPVFRRRPRPHRSLYARPPHPPQQSQCSASRRGGMGKPLGLQQNSRRPHHRFCARHPTQRGRHYRNDEDRRHLRNPLCRHSPSLHRTHRHRAHWSTAWAPSQDPS